MLFPDMNKEKTKANVDNLLSNYHSFKRIAGQPVEQSVTATFSFEPKGSGFGVDSKVERGVLKKVSASEVIEQIQRALNLLSVESRKRLHQKYIHSYKRFDYEIYSAENISKSSYYRTLERAQLEFAEAYQHGELIEYLE